MDDLALLERGALTFDRSRTARALEGRRVLVTGAGGSIGRALCRRLAVMPLGRLVMLDRNGESLERTLDGLECEAEVRDDVVDVTEKRLLQDVVGEEQPDIAYHAAALKHVVPLETRLLDALRVNVLGTANMIAACDKAEVDHRILLSTDKAVRPRSIMGVSKLLAERLWRAAPSGRSVIVRLVNVLGTRDSVLPAFRELARAGEPLPVASPDVSRWFITTSEAVEILAAASWIGATGEIIVPELHDPTPIESLARRVLAQEGAEDGTIAPRPLGPGEKRAEERLGEGEMTVRTPIPSLQRVIPDRETASTEWLEGLSAALDARDPLEAMRVIVGVLPEYVPSSALLDTLESAQGRS